MFEWINEPHRPRATPMYACKQTAEKKNTNELHRGANDLFNAIE